MRIKIKQMLGSNVLIRQHEDDETLGSGILFRPDVAIEKPLYATVIAIGSGERHSKLDDRVLPEVKPGDVVVIRQWSGSILDEREDPKVKICHMNIIESKVVTGVAPDPKALALIEEVKANAQEG